MRAKRQRGIATRAPSPALDFERWIVWEDDWLVAVDKPAGVLSQGGEGGALVNLVDLGRRYLKRADVAVLHRIDRNVSGLVLLAKHAGAARSMTRLIQRGDLMRTYRAVVVGVPAADRLLMDAWLAKDRASNRVRAADADALRSMADAARADFRPARTEAAVLTRFEAPLGACATLDVRPITGRSHQIRVHLAHAGLPIVGDPKYGVAAERLNRPLLHAAGLEFVHPQARKHVRLTAPLPWDEAALSRLRRTRVRSESSVRNRGSSVRG